MQLGSNTDVPRMKKERRGSSGSSTSGKEGLLAKLLSGGRSKLGGMVGKDLGFNRISAPAASAYHQAGPSCTKEDSPKQDSTAASAPCQASHSPLDLSGPIWLGFPRDMEAHYSLGPEIGSGGNGVVRHCVEHPVRSTTQCSYACKTVPKIPKDRHKTAKHLDNLRREISVLTRLQSSLNIIKLQGVFEDEHSVHIIMENCRGGELASAIGKRHYSERTAASYMRAVLRTLAQCHAHNVLHRDIKPGNFMLLNDDIRSPVKAIDLGLAVPYEKDGLPLTHLGLEGTPWFMAPEALASEYYPASDVWSAGVMAYQLLTGKLPFNDKRNPTNPSLTAVWRSVLNDDLGFDKPCWEGISQEAKDFVRTLLDRDHRKRPSAKDALKHPWLKGDSSERSVGRQLQQSVVARIQRFGNKSALKRSVLQMIASELLSHDSHHPVHQSTLHQPHGSSSHGRPVIPGPAAPALKDLLRHMHLENGERRIDASQVAKTLDSLGLHLDRSEVERLFSQLDLHNDGEVGRSVVVASQVDWHHLQKSHKEAWLQMAKDAFTSLDTDRDGVLRIDEIVARLSRNLPESEVTAAVEHALEEAGQAGETQGLVFSDFMHMLKCGSEDSLDLYDQRRGSLAGSASVDRLNKVLQNSVSTSSLGDCSRHGHGTDGSNHSQLLLSPARTADPASNLSLVDWDPSAHGGNHRSCELRDGSSRRGGYYGAGGVVNSAVPLAGGCGSSIRGSIAAAAMARSAANNGAQGSAAHGAHQSSGIGGSNGVPGSTSTGGLSLGGSSMGTGGVTGPAGASVWRFDDAVPAARAPQQQQQQGQQGQRVGAPASSTFVIPNSNRSRAPAASSSPAPAAGGGVAAGPAAPAWRFDTAGEEWGASPGVTRDAQGVQGVTFTSVGDTDARSEGDTLSKEGSSRGASPLAARLPDGRHHGSSLYINNVNLSKSKLAGSRLPLSTVRE